MNLFQSGGDDDFSELPQPPTEISESIRNFKGDPNDRKAILAHRKKVAVAEARLQAEWESFEKKQVFYYASSHNGFFFLLEF